MKAMIYCRNDEQHLFLERKEELRVSNIDARFIEIKYRCYEPCDLVLTLPLHEKTVREIFHRSPHTRIEVYDGSKKGTKVVTPMLAKEVNDGSEEGKKQVGEGRQSGGVQGRQQARQEGSGEEKVIIPVSRNTQPKQKEI